MLIRTGILCVPQFDDDACRAIRSILRRMSQTITVLQEIGVGDQRHWVEETLRRWCDEEELDLILTSGGSMPAPGPSSKQIVPTATLAVTERVMLGMADRCAPMPAIRHRWQCLDRGLVGIRGRTLIVNLPAGAPATAFFLEGIVN